MDKNIQQIELSARHSVNTPCAAAIAGILFSILLASTMVLLWVLLLSLYILADNMRGKNRNLKSSDTNIM